MTTGVCSVVYSSKKALALLLFYLLKLFRFGNLRGSRCLLAKLKVAAQKLMLQSALFITVTSSLCGEDRIAFPDKFGTNSSQWPRFLGTSFLSRALDLVLRSLTTRACFAKQFEEYFRLGKSNLYM